MTKSILSNIIILVLIIIIIGIIMFTDYQKPSAKTEFLTCIEELNMITDDECQLCEDMVYSKNKKIDHVLHDNDYYFITFKDSSELSYLNLDEFIYFIKINK